MLLIIQLKKLFLYILKLNLNLLPNLQNLINFQDFLHNFQTKQLINPISMFCFQEDFTYSF